MTDEPQAKEEFFDWAYDTRYIKERNNNIAWSLAGVFALLAVSAIIAVVAMTPLKETVPFVFTVDRNTGIIEARTVSDTLHWSAEDTEDYANVAEYIKLREEFLHATYPSAYEKAVRMSAGIARAELIENYAPAAARSPMMQLGKNVQVDIRFKSITHHGSNKNVVIARYIKDTKRYGESVSTHHIATVQFEYSVGQTLKLSNRLENPNGFVVSNYQDSEEGHQQ